MRKRTLKSLRVLTVLVLVAIVTALVGGCAEPSPPLPPSEQPTVPPEEKPPKEAPYLNVSPFEVAAKIFDERLVEEQREEIWNTQYKGKRVKWFAQYDPESYYYGRRDCSTIGEREQVDLEISWQKPREEVEELLKEGEVFLFTGVLDSYSTSELFQAKQFRLDEGGIISIVLKKLWSREAIGTLGGVDKQHIYLYRHHYSVWERPKELKVIIYVLDKTNGYFIKEESFQVHMPIRYDEAEAIAITREKILAIADDCLVSAQQEPARFNFDGFILKLLYSHVIWSNYLACYDASEKFLWGADYSVSNIAIFNQMLFFCDGELQAFQISPP